MRKMTDSVHGTWYTDNYKVGDLVQVYDDRDYFHNSVEVIGFNGDLAIINIGGKPIEWRADRLSLRVTLEQRIENKQKEVTELQKLLITN